MNRKKLTKASKISEAYQGGERNFQGSNLQGQNFVGEDLSGADFSGSNIRGANFTKAKLQGTHFNNIQAGLKKDCIYFNLIFLCVSFIVIGFCTSYISILIALFSPRKVFTLEQTIWLLVLEILIIGLSLFVSYWLSNLINNNSDYIAEVIFIILFFALSFHSSHSNEIALLKIGLLPFIMLAFHSGLLITNIILAVATDCAKIIKVISFISALFFAVCGSWICQIININIDNINLKISIVSTIMIVVFTFAYNYFTWNQKNYTQFRVFAIWYSTLYGTNFKNADLTEASFKSSVLNNTKFTEAILFRVYWKDVKGLDSAFVKNTYLENKNLKNLLVTGKGKNIKFDQNNNLNSLNLNNAVLSNVKFVGTDLHNTSLQNSTLIKCIFIRANLDGVDFTNATLEDPCIQTDCNITQNTIFYQVKCRRLYLEDYNNDKACLENFSNSEEFVNYIKWFVNIIDFTHPKDKLNEEAVIRVLVELSKKYQESFKIVGYNRRGNKDILKIQIPNSVNSQDIRDEYYPRYDQTLSLLERRLNTTLEPYAEKQLIEFKINRKFILEQSINQNKYNYSNLSITMNYYEICNNNINGTGASILNSGNIHIEESHSSSVSSDNVKELESLLEKISQVINESDISNEDKQRSLDHVSVIAEAASDYHNETLQSKAKKAVGFLKVIADTVEPARKLGQGFYELLFAIKNFF